jgi:hypothetical protein
VLALAVPVTLLFALAGSLDDAATARDAGDHEACGKAVQDALATGALDVADVARAWTLRGQCFSLAGDADRAERSYAVALRLDAAANVEGDAAFALAKRTLPAVPGLAAQVSFVDEAGTLEVELLGDDLLLVKGASIVRGADEVARVPLEVGHAKHKVSGVERGPGLVALLLDKHGNALVRLPIDPAVKKVFTPAPDKAPAAGAPGAAPTLLTTLGATAIGAGIVGVVTSGIALAALGDTALDEGGVWVVGVGASTGLFLVGAGLVVVDQGL